MREVRDFFAACVPCLAANTRAPLEVSKAPERVWQRYSADFKGPIVGDFCLHVMIDEMRRFPVVQVMKSTGFKELKRKMEDIFGMFGIP